MDLFIFAGIITYLGIGTVIMRIFSRYFPDTESVFTIVGWPLFLVLMLLYRLFFGRWESS